MTQTPGDGRGRILQAARTMFLERGYADVSMQQIASAAGVTKATLYHHFRDKEDLFIEVVRIEHDSMGQMVLDLIAGAETLEEQLQRIARGVFDVGKGDFGRLAEDLRQHVSPERAQQLQEHMHAPMATGPENVLRDLFVQAMERGEIERLNPTVPFTAFFSMLIGMSRFSEHAAGFGTFTEEDIAMIPKILLYGIATKDRGVRP
ncbi:MAG TPA: helix-turn-helix domain-containing protein [Thermomicrobiales bacterium]|nr:helix-turn-helix domain-containing protein [Thermomicrobiales bacterium]